MSTDERMKMMECRMARMRWINRCLIACIVLSLGVWFIWTSLGPETAWAQSGAKVIRANCFVLEDDNGKQRAKLMVDENGTSLRTYGEDGKTRLVLGETERVPALWLFDENGKAHADLTVDKDGPMLSLCSQNSERGVRLAVFKGVPMLSLSDENSKGGAALLVSKGVPTLSLRDENGKTIWSAP